MLSGRQDLLLDLLGLSHQSVKDEAPSQVPRIDCPCFRDGGGAKVGSLGCLVHVASRSCLSNKMAPGLDGGENRCAVPEESCCERPGRHLPGPPSCLGSARSFLLHLKGSEQLSQLLLPIIDAS